MKIKWLGHSSFVLTESTGTTVLTDPFDPEMVGYAAPPQQVDIVTVSHGHADHSYIKGVKSYDTVLDKAGTYEKDGIHISGVPSLHDDDGGKQRGKNVIFKFGLDGVSVCHMGDIGEPCSPELVERLLPVNVLLIPVGGNYTIDAEQAKEYVERLMPDIVIPMHYKIKHCELDIDKVDQFERLFDGDCVEDGVDELDLDRVDFSIEDRKATRLVIMNRTEN